MASEQASPRRSATLVRFADQPQGRTYDFLIEPDAPAREALANTLGISGIRKLRFEGSLAPEGRKDWQLTATLGATVVQPCVATLAPVSTRIDEAISRRYLANMPAPEAGEVEMPEDDTIESQPAELDLLQVMAEALALALPSYPRASDADLVDISVTEPGIAPLTDADMKPFAGLAALRDQLSDDGKDES